MFGDHAWNAVQIDGSWFLLDCTWALPKIENEYITLNKKLCSRLFSHFNNKTVKWLLIKGITKNKIKMRGVL